MKNASGMAKISQLSPDGTVPKIQCGICKKMVNYHSHGSHHNKCKRSTKRLNKSKFNEYKRKSYQL